MALWMLLGHPLHEGTILRMFPIKRALVCAIPKIWLYFEAIAEILLLHNHHKKLTLNLLEDRLIDLSPLTVSPAKSIKVLDKDAPFFILQKASTRFSKTKKYAR
jgi:hypothetical protein